MNSKLKMGLKITGIIAGTGLVSYAVGKTTFFIIEKCSKKDKDEVEKVEAKIVK